MANNSPPSPQGNTSNTPTQSSAASGVMSPRTLSINWKLIVGIIGVVSVIIVVLTYYALGVGGAAWFLTGLVVAYIGNQIKKKPDMSAGGIIAHVGIGIAATTLIASPYVQKPLEWFDLKSEQIKRMSLSACAAELNVADGSRPSFTVGRNCYQDIRLGKNDPRFITRNTEFHGSIDNYLIYSYPEKDVVRVSPNATAFPADEDELPVNISRFVPKGAASAQ